MELNRLGMTKEQMDEIFTEETTQEIKDFVNKHFCWEDRNRVCKICGERVRIRE